MWRDISAAAQSFGPAPMYTWVTDVARIELSGTTFLNAVSKASNMLVDGMDIEPSDRLCIDLGNHWQSPIWMSAVASIQAVVCDSDDASLIVTNGRNESVNRSGKTTIVISQDPFGMPEKVVPVGTINGSLEVRGFGDHFAPRQPAQPSDELCVVRDLHFDVAVLTDLAHEAMSTHGITAGQRIAIGSVNGYLETLLWHVVVPVVARCSVVLLDDVTNQADVCERERVDRLISVTPVLDVKE